jgi:hypothetical protein
VILAFKSGTWCPKEAMADKAAALMVAFSRITLL